MTIYGHNRVMKTGHDMNVQIAEFKAKLSQYLHNVRRGHPLTLLNRDTPVARVVPYPGDSGRLLVRRPSRNVKDVHLPPPLRRRVDSLDALLKERQQGR
jgi:prevent-host-death family protein